MLLKNNSANEWKQYNIGRGIYVDIAPYSNFEVPDYEAAQNLLSLLGSPEWITIYDDSSEENPSLKEVVEKLPKKERVDDSIEPAPKKKSKKK